VPAAGRVGVRELVHDTELRLARENCRDVHFLEYHAAIVNAPPRHDLEVGQLGLGLGAPVWALSIASFLGGMGLAVHLTLWFTVFQREIPEHAQSRVSSYDALGSFVLTPMGLVLAGVFAAAIGVSPALWLAAGAILVLNALMLLIPEVWTVGRRAEPTTLTA